MAGEDKLRQREMQGRSASMMQHEMRLPWGSTLLSPKSPEAQQLKRRAVEEDRELGLRAGYETITMSLVACAWRICMTPI